MQTSHHSAFDHWWEYAAENYVTWDDGRPVAIDLYYDPVVDKHRGGSVGLIAPAWYLAPQRREIAEAGWNMGAMIAGLHRDGDVTGVQDPRMGVMLTQLAGEFADESTKARLWTAADDHFEPTWDRDLGEFTMGFGLDEPHPRGQWNARAMAGWVCTPGAWGRIFNEPNVAKFDEPTIVNVDFPRVALSEARWDGDTLHLAAQPQNASVRNTRTTITVTNLDTTEGWQLVDATGVSRPLAPSGRDIVVELTADNEVVHISRR